MKGKLIVIDGTDGSGKATQAGILIEGLRKKGLSVVKADFPVYDSFFGKLAAKYLNGEFGTADQVSPYLASLIFALDRWEASSDMKKALDEGSIIIANRYVSSNIGHQAGKIKDKAKRKEFVKWIEGLEYGEFGIPRPDLNILLYVPYDIGQKLVDRKEKRDYTDMKRDIHEGDASHLKDAECSFLEVAKEKGWVIIDCVRDGKLMQIEEISSIVKRTVEEKLGI